MAFETRRCCLQGTSFVELSSMGRRRPLPAIVIA